MTPWACWRWHRDFWADRLCQVIAWRVYSLRADCAACSTLMKQTTAVLMEFTHFGRPFWT